MTTIENSASKNLNNEKVVFGNHSAVIVPRKDRDRIRNFYCDVLGWLDAYLMHESSALH